MSNRSELSIDFGQDGSYVNGLSDFLNAHFGGFVGNNEIGSRTGIYLVTNTAGIRESVGFWRDALEKTPSFANPANFPWTLSNAPASFIAKALQIKGPVFTFVGDEDAVLFSGQRAMIDLKQQTISEALMIRLDIVDKKLKISFTILDAEFLNKDVGSIVLSNGCFLGN